MAERIWFHPGPSFQTCVTVGTLSAEMSLVTSPSTAELGPATAELGQDPENPNPKAPDPMRPPLLLHAEGAACVSSCGSHFPNRAQRGSIWPSATGKNITALPRNNPVVPSRAFPGSQGFLAREALAGSSIPHDFGDPIKAKTQQSFGNKHMFNSEIDSL